MTNPIRAPKPAPERLYIEVPIVHGKGWKWRVCSRPNASLLHKVQRVAYDLTYDWLRREMSRTIEQTVEKPTGIPPSQVVNRNVTNALASVMDKLVIPDDEMVNKHIDRFYAGANLETFKIQMDLICEPIGNAPKVSEVIESGEADDDVLKNIREYFFGLPITGTPDESENNSGVNENSSSETTQEETTSKKKKGT